MSPKQIRFAAEYAVDCNATKAAERAGYSQRTANEQGARLLANVSVQALIADHQAKLAKDAQIDAVKVLKQLQDIATCDPNEIVQTRREACRYCWGKDHRFQFTQAEFESYIESHRRKCEESEREGKDAPAFDPKGGDGFNPKREPCRECPECFGDGKLSVYIADTRTLSKAAKRLYAGVKQTRDGIEIKLNDQVNALINIAKHLGMYTEKVDVTSGGKPLEATVNIYLPDNGRDIATPEGPSRTVSEQSG